MWLWKSLNTNTATTNKYHSQIFHFQESNMYVEFRKKFLTRLTFYVGCTPFRGTLSHVRSESSYRKVAKKLVTLDCWGVKEFLV